MIDDIAPVCGNKDTEGSPSEWMAKQDQEEPLVLLFSFTIENCPCQLLLLVSKVGD